MSSRGVIYLATGSDLQHQLLAISRQALATLHPDLDQVVLSDRPAVALDSPSVTAQIDYWRVEPVNGYASRTVKTRLAEVRCFERSLFLDNDVVAARPIDDVWGYLDQYDLAVAHDNVPRLEDALVSGLQDGLLSPAEAAATQAACGNHMPYFNTGVLLWRKSPAVDQFFAAWHQEWQRFQQRDQFAFCRALAETGLPIAILPPIYNMPVFENTAPSDLAAARLLHFWAGEKLQLIKQWNLASR
jgi:hypothetical protein